MAALAALAVQIALLSRGRLALPALATESRGKKGSGETC